MTGLLTNRQDVEALIIHLILSKYLKEDFHQTAYSVNVYVIPGPQAIRLTRLSKLRVEAGEGSRVSTTFALPVQTKRKSKIASKAKGRQKHDVNTSDAEGNFKAQSEEEIMGLNDNMSEDEWDDPPPPRSPVQVKSHERSLILPSSVTLSSRSNSSLATKLNRASSRALKPSAPKTIIPASDSEDESIVPVTVSNSRPRRKPISATSPLKRIIDSDSDSAHEGVGSSTRNNPSVRKGDEDVVQDSEEEELDPSFDGWSFSLVSRGTDATKRTTSSKSQPSRPHGSNIATPEKSKRDDRPAKKKPRTSLMEVLAEYGGVAGISNGTSAENGANIDMGTNGRMGKRIDVMEISD